MSAKVKVSPNAFLLPWVPHARQRSQVEEELFSVRVQMEELGKLKARIEAENRALILRNKSPGPLYTRGFHRRTSALERDPRSLCNHSTATATGTVTLSVAAVTTTAAGDQESMSREREINGRGHSHQWEATGGSLVSTCGLLSSRRTILKKPACMSGSGARLD